MDKETKKSIELGFNGKKPPEFYAKWKLTNKKRFNHLWELFGFIAMFFILLWTYAILYPSNMAQAGILTPQSHFKLLLQGILIILIIVSLLAIWKNCKTWIDMFHVMKERFDEYEKNRQR